MATAVNGSGRLTLVVCRRWKAASTGVEPLRELQAAGRAREAQELVYVAAGDITEQARGFAQANGIRLVPEGRRLFPSLTVEENLLAGAYRRRSGPWNVGSVIELFPWIGQRRRQSARSLSGGEQQAVAIGRALMGNPRLLLLDEISLGLSPVAAEGLYGAMPDILAAGTTVLLVEQDVSQALRIADEVLCLLEGRTVLTGTPADLTSEQIESAYFGLAAARGSGP